MISLKSTGSSKWSRHTIASGMNYYSRAGFYKGVMVAVKRIEHVQQVNISDRVFLQEMAQLYDLTHANIAKFMGTTIDVSNLCILTEYCHKGSLQDLLENEGIDLDKTFRLSIQDDIVKGLQYLHTSSIKAHGNLKSPNCVVDGRFVVKLTDFGPSVWQKTESAKANALLWTAPELLLEKGRKASREPSADIYSLGIIFQEILLREGPFYLEDYMNTEQIIRRVHGQEIPPFRPSLPDDEIKPDMKALIEACWNQTSKDRPTIDEVAKKLKLTFGPNMRSGNLMDNLMNRMEQYAQNLEGLVSDRTDKYLEEKKRLEELLHRLLPKSIAVELQANTHVVPKTFDCVTVYFSDIVHFTALCSESTPMEVVTLLNDLYTRFDGIIAMFDVYKVETIGDAYMAVSGLPEKNENHASEVGKMALGLLNSARNFTIRHRPDLRLQLRIGIHSGPCAAGVVGFTMPRYCLFGDTINMASRMESNGEAMRIHLSPDTRNLLERTNKFIITERGHIDIKGKGEICTYWLKSQR